MDITVRQHITITDTKPVESIEDIKNAKRLFYELGEHPSTVVYHPTRGINIKTIHWDKWENSGVFKEIKNIEHMLKHDNLLNNPDYIKRHNFRYI